MKTTLISPRRSAQALGLLGLTFLFSCAALDDLNRTGGNSRRGYFTITPDAELAVGSWLSFSVGDYETLSGPKSGIGLTKPTSKAPSIAKIRDFDSSGTLNLGGVKAGSTDITFTATADDESLEDSFDVRVSTVTDLSFHPCANNAAYVRGAKAKLPYRFNEGSKKKLLGRGLFPLTVSPSTSATLDKSGSDEAAFSINVASGAVANVTIRSNLSGDDSEETWTMIDESEIDDLAYEAPSTTDAGQVVSLDLRPVANGKVVCSAVRRILRNLNPHACTIEGEVDGEFVTTAATANLSLDAVDACLLEVEFPGGSKIFSLDPIIVTSPPRSGSSGGLIDD